MRTDQLAENIFDVLANTSYMPIAFDLLRDEFLDNNIELAGDVIYIKDEFGILFTITVEDGKDG